MLKIKLLFIFFILSIFSFSLLSSATIIVDINGGGDYTTIQEGIDASTNEDTVLVYPGTYYENVNFNGKSITLASLELTTGDESYIDSTVIDGNQNGSCIRLDNEETSVIRGFSIINGYGDFLQSNVGHIGGGIMVHSSVFDENKINISIINCKLYNNYAEGGGGIIIRKSIAYLSGVDIYNNYACGGGGIYVRDDSELIFDDINRCNIYNNYAGSGSDMLGVDTGDIEVIVDTFTVLEPLGYFAEYSQNVHNTGEFTFDIQNYWLETVNHNLYVATDGDDSNSGLTPDEPLRTIAWAIHKIESDSLDPKTVYVASGTYSQILNDQIFPLGCKSYVSIIGENANTILLNDAYASQVITARYNKNNFSIENFTLHSSYEDINKIISFWECNNLVLRNLIIEDCISNDHQISFVYKTSDILYENVIFRNNTAPGTAGLHQERHNAILRNCIFENNYSTSWNSDLYFIGTDYITIENCIFSNSNTQHQDFCTFIIGEWQFCEVVKNIKNTLFYNNSSPGVATIGICGDGAGEIGETNITNCTFANNSSTHSTLLLVGEEINITNTIMYDSTDYEIRLPDCTPYGIVCTLNVDHCNIKNGEDGIWNQNAANVINWSDSNIDEDPLFIGTGDYPFALSALSPCIDAGTPDTTGLNLPELDLAGNPRIFNDTIDMGAYECQDTIGVDEPDYPLFIFDLFQNNPNPFSAKGGSASGGSSTTTISFILASYKHLSEYTLSIYNIRGQLIKTFYGREDNFWVKRDIEWDGTDEDGNKVAPGVYFYKLNYGNNSLTKKMLLVQ